MYQSIDVLLFSPRQDGSIRNKEFGCLGGSCSIAVEPWDHEVESLIPNRRWAGSFLLLSFLLLPSILINHNKSVLNQVPQRGATLRNYGKVNNKYLSSVMEQVSQADGWLLWWMYTPIGGLDSGLLWPLQAPQSFQWSVATIHRAWGGEKLLSLPLQNTYLEVGGSNPMTGKSFSPWSLIACLKRWDDVHAQADFPILLLSNTTCLVLLSSFLPALPSSSWIFAQVVRWTCVSFCSIQYSKGQFQHALWVPKIQLPPSTITLSALPSSYFDLLVCWVGSS